MGVSSAGRAKGTKAAARSLKAYLKEIAALCGIQKQMTFHAARHTFAITVTLLNGVPMESVSKMLGHKNLSTMQHYAKILDVKVRWGGHAPAAAEASNMW